MTNNRFMLVLTGVNVFLVASTLAIAAPDRAPVLRAQEIELVDAKGTRRASLKTEAGGEVVLRMMAPDGDIRVKLGAGSDGSGLILMADDSQPGVHALAKSVGTTLTLADKNAAPRVVAP